MSYRSNCYTTLSRSLELIAACSLLALVGCNSTPSSKSPQNQVAMAATHSEAAHMDVMCLGDLINNPPEPFHYSYKYADASGSVDKEADITPQQMDITVANSSGSHSYHGVRSDDVSWNGAVLDLSGLNLTTMSARLNSLNESSAVTRGNTETVNGYQTTKYAIDTTNASSSDKQKFESLFGKGSFEKGTIWVASDSCAVQLVLDEGLWQSDGSIKKDHFEISRIRK